MMNEIKVSVVIPVYNTARYLRDCLDSVINQSYTNIEIVCVNDGSTDNSIEILKEYEKNDKRVKVYSKENEGKGAASARNMGLDNASGDYILFLDSDDIFDVNMIELLSNNVNDTNADVVVFDAIKFDNEFPEKTSYFLSIDLNSAPQKAYFDVNDCAERIYQICDLFAWNKMFKRKLLVDNNLKFEAIPISDDQYIPAIALALAKRISVVNKVLLKYRFNTGTSQCDRRFAHPEAAYIASYSIVEKLKEIGKYDLLKQSYSNMAVRLMREYFDIMISFDNLKFLYEKYRNEVFEKLEIANVDMSYFYDFRLGKWFELIQKYSLEDILMQASRAYGSNMTTAILRFQFPYDKVPKGSKIILVGKGMVGRYWYAQLLLSDYAEVVAWLEDDTDISAYNYDQCIYAR